jgi:hypothetical protein
MMSTAWKIGLIAALIMLAYFAWHLIPAGPVPTSDGMEAVFL